MNYWLFNYNEENVEISKFLEKGNILTVPVENNAQKIEKGDKVIIWQSGKLKGCLGLGMIISELLEAEGGAGFFVTILVNFNLRTDPISKKLLGSTVSNFDKFYKDLKKDCYRASQKQYELLLEVIQENGLAVDASSELTQNTVPIFPHNIILYGPTGTGKTYRTINYALAIIEQKPLEVIAQESRRDLRSRYEQYMEDGYIHFITFHENFKYRDFVEGIRSNAMTGQAEIDDGVFKQVALEAKRSIVESLLQNMPSEENSVDFNQLYAAFLKFIKTDNFKAFITPMEKKILLHKIAQFGHISVRPQNSFSVYTISKHKIKKLYTHFKNGIPIQNLQDEISKVVGGANPMAIWSVFAELKRFEVSYRQNIEEENPSVDVDDLSVKEFEINKMKDIANFQSKRHVLIIDEIDRGDIAKTFGEVLSILGSKKREGAPEGQAVILPYSKTYFSIPPNLYLIGTMNVSDNALAKMDAGWRSRFNFIKLKPRPEVLPRIISEGKEIDLGKMLYVINKRIQILLGEDYGIGHAHLIDVQDFQQLKWVFFGKMVPLLIDYFNGNVEKIGLVLGRDFFHFYNPGENGNILADFSPEVNKKYHDRKKYLLKAYHEVNDDAFINIYKALVPEEKKEALAKNDN